MTVGAANWNRHGLMSLFSVGMGLVHPLGMRNLCSGGVLRMGSRRGARCGLGAVRRQVQGGSPFWLGPMVSTNRSVLDWWPLSWLGGTGWGSAIGAPRVLWVGWVVAVCVGGFKGGSPFWLGLTVLAMRSVRGW